MSVDTAYFDALYAASGDPWRVRDRWYEVRKRALLLAALPAEHYGRAFEPGCGNGEFTVALAPRCEALLATDLHPRAVVHARQRTAQLPQVQVAQGAIPQDWPGGQFDLIVLAELGYYFDADDWQAVAARVAAALSPTGTLVACHWRHPFAARRQDTAAVHATLAACAPLHEQLCHQEPDLLLHVWTRQPPSVAQREGLVAGVQTGGGGAGGTPGRAAPAGPARMTGVGVALALAWECIP